MLIDAFESDMRQTLNRYVLDHLTEQEAVGDKFEKANKRRESDDSGDDASIVEYLDLQDACDLLNRHRECLPAEFGREFRDSTPHINQLIPVRNRVMHGRPLKPDDPEQVARTLELFKTRYWQRTCDILERVKSDPSWQPPFELQKRSADKILHNLPLSDYDETGLIGRDRDLKEVVNTLINKRTRKPMVTLVGEGGIGKTAVALDVAYQVLDAADSPYECILWVSLKTERLTGTGITQIGDAIRDITDATRILGQTFDLDFSGELSELAEVLEGVNTLLVIDNLETVNGSDVMTLYETLPDTVNYLFTSRIGIGEIERRYPIGPLADADARHLLRKFAGTRGVKRIVQWSNDTVSEAVASLRNSPLAIRWYVLAVEAGQEPNLALADQNQLLEFCVRSVYNVMPVQSKEILLTLSALGRSATFDELAVLTELPVDALRSAVHGLQNGSMAASESDKENQLVSRIRLTESAEQYLRTVNPPESAGVRRVLKREENFHKSEERRRADEESRFLFPNTVRIRNEYDTAAAHYLRLALSVYRKESLDKALASARRARELNPEYWEVDRVEAFLLSSHGHTSRARSLYQNALRNCSDGESRAVVSFFFSSHLLKKERSTEEAAAYARQSHDYFNHPETAKHLGDVLVSMREFSEGQELILWALENTDGKFRLMALTSLIDSWRRWSEFAREREHSPSKAAEYAHAGYANGVKEIVDGTNHLKLANSVLECISVFIRSVTDAGVDTSRYTRECLDMVGLVRSNIVLFEKTRSWSRIAGHVGKLYRNKTTANHVATLCSDLLSVIAPVSLESDPQEGLVGVVSSWRKTYGFISHSKYPDGVFMPAALIDGLNERGEEVNLEGRRVRFVAEPVDGGRPRVIWSVLL